MENFYDRVNSDGGAVFAAVCRGKVSNLVDSTNSVKVSVLLMLYASYTVVYHVSVTDSVQFAYVSVLCCIIQFGIAHRGRCDKECESLQSFKSSFKNTSNSAAS